MIKATKWAWEKALRIIDSAMEQVAIGVDWGIRVSVAIIISFALLELAGFTGIIEALIDKPSTWHIDV